MLQSINIKKLTAHTLTGILLAGSFVIQSSENKALAGTPETNWSPTNTMTDCYGMDNQSYGVSGTPCQNYQGDLYENWNPNDGGHGDTDIKTFSVGEDQGYFILKTSMSISRDCEQRRCA